ncbi:esterase YqiA [Vibrio sp. UCD-FRSSP16_10]|uniref:esterase YqiA n=1 Tax=unclassified Vibrio TaxID=2614977 RepID=UPI0007FF5EA9|nr:MULTISPECIES: esterase YqiA [unclassified Vibrio]OBT07364.1 esterase YqiA [Vibrio sp. UCD-FRSSP16_30]OBT12843.1 esterase YqiA [Vibrio sp. UCD-FRSSP16_10]
MTVSRKPSMLLYLHGFNSSPQSHKAQVMRQFCTQYRPDIRFVAPALPVYPDACIKRLQELCDEWVTEYEVALVGSSMGGYLSTWLNQKYGFKAALINPAVKPFELLQDYLGPQFNPYSKEQYLLEQVHVEQLKAIYVPLISNVSDFWLLQQKGDEVLDYRQAIDKYQGCKQTVEEGGDHSFIGFERYSSAIVEFLQL